MKNIVDIRRKSWYGVKISLQKADVETFQPSQSGAITHESKDLCISTLQKKTDEMTPDKSGSSSDEDFHR